MKVIRLRPGVLQLTKSRSRTALHLGFSVLGLAAWYWVISGFNPIPWKDPTPVTLLFWLAPVFGLPEVFRLVRVFVSGETFTLRRDTRTIERNGTRVAQFGEVAMVQIRKIRSEDSVEHRLSIVLKNEDKLRLHQSTDGNEITTIAEDIADLLGVKVTQTD